MKKKWAIALAAAVAAVIPYSRKEDPETGAKAIQALLWRYTCSADGDTTLSIGLILGKNELPKSREEAPEAPAEEAQEA